MIGGPVFVSRAVSVCKCLVQTSGSDPRIRWKACSLRSRWKQMSFDGGSPACRAKWWAALVIPAWLTGNSGCCRSCCRKARSCRSIAGSGLRQRTGPLMALPIFSDRSYASAICTFDENTMIHRLLRTGGVEQCYTILEPGRRRLAACEL